MINNHPLVSIIACCYNHEKFVEETLDGIISQTYENIELIIIDDFSTDNSVTKINNWIKKHKHECLFIQNIENIGVVKTLNKALIKCKGKYFSMISCDDIYLPKKIESQIHCFEKIDDDYSAIYSDAYIIDKNSIYQYGTQISINQINKPSSGNIYEDLIRKDNFIPALSVIYKTEIIEELGYYDESLIYEDYDMLLRLSKQYKIYFQKEIECCYRQHQTNMNYNLDKPMFLDSKIKTLFKHLNTENSNSEIGIVIKEKILYLCELLYMQNSKLLKPHIKKLRTEYNYGKIIFFSNYFKLTWKIYLIIRVILSNRQQRLTLNTK